MTLGDFDFRGGQAAPGKQRLDRGEVGYVMGHADALTDFGGIAEFAVVALSVVDRQCMDVVAGCP